VLSLRGILAYKDIHDESGIQTVEIHGIDHQLLYVILTNRYFDQVDIIPYKIDDLSKIVLNYGLARLHTIQIFPLD